MITFQASACGLRLVSPSHCLQQTWIRLDDLPPHFSFLGHSLQAQFRPLMAMTSGDLTLVKALPSDDPAEVIDGSEVQGSFVSCYSHVSK